MKKKQLILKMLALLACMLSSVSAMAAVEAYACHTLSNTTLTFYYDGQRASRTGTTYNLNTGDKVPAWYWDENYKSVTRVVFDPSFANARPTSTYRWFFEMTNLQSITGWAYLNTASVTNMYGMFYYCPGLTSLDLSRFNTANVTDMGYMFYKCTGLTSLDLSSFNTANVTNMHSMFSLCEGLTRVDVSNFNTANVTDMGCMFNGCSGLTSLDVSSFNTANVEYMDNMFTDCSGLTSLDVSSFSTANVTEMQSMFEGCSGLTSLDLTLFNTASVIRMYDMFKDCSNLMTIYASDRWSTAAAIWATNMFSGCTNLVGGQGTTYDPNNVGFQYAQIDGGPRNPGYFTDKNAPKAYACYTSSNTTLTFYYDKQSSSRPGTIYNLNIGAATPGWYNDQYYYQVKQVVFDPSFTNARPTSTYYWFYGMTNLLSITGIEYLNTEEVTTMYGMFENCYRLTSLDVSHFNTANVTNMRGMFYGCSGLTTLDLSSFNTANVTDMYALFDSCSGLTSLDVSSFNTANVTDMQRMFSACSGLTTLDLSSFNTAKVTNMRFMFPNCSGLKTIYVGDEWSTAAVTNSASMFYGCTNLVGGQGTTYNASHVDATYAHIDGGPSNPGYFSMKPEGYACFTETTLTFYYDTLRNTRSGTTYDLNTGGNDPGWLSDGTYSLVTQVVFDPSFAQALPASTYRWFYNMTNLLSITGMEYLNTQNVTDMSYMFNNCRSLTSLDLSYFCTTSVETMYRMFYSCTGLTSLDLSSFNTRNVTNMGYMFYYCSGLTSLEVSGFNTQNVTDMSYMFYNCRGLTSLDLNYFNTSRVETMYQMFSGCSSLTELDLSKFNTPILTDMNYMFNNCSSLTSLDLSSFNTSNVTTMAYTFNGCSGLTSLDVSSFDTRKVKYFSYMFQNCSGLTTLDLSSFSAASAIGIAYMFQYCSGLTTIYAGDVWNAASVTDSKYMFRGCTSLVGSMGTTYDANHVDKAYAHIDGGPSNPGYFSAVPEAYACYTSSNTTLTFYYDYQRASRSDTTYDLNTGDINPGWINDGTNSSVTRVVFDSSFANARPTSTYWWFYNMSNLLSITGIQYLNTAKVTNMSCMFFNCSSLTSLDLSSFNTAKVTDMSWMFCYCNGLSSLDVSGFNTAKVTTMFYMFAKCSSLTSFDVSHFNTANVTSMCGMFAECYDLTSIDVSNFNTAMVTNMGYMFSNCRSLSRLDLSNFYTGNVTNMKGMFLSCYGLTSLDLSGFNTAKVTDMSSMFDYSRGLTTIYVGDYWNTGAVTASENMFLNCTALVGSRGTAYNADHIDKTYAHIDGGPSNPGYLSRIIEAYACFTESDSTLTFFYDDERNTRLGPTYGMNTGEYRPNWVVNHRYSVAQVVFDPSFANARPTSACLWFDNMINLRSITGIEYLNTDSVTNMNMMFGGCRALTSLDVSGFNTSNVTDMSHMFYDCESLTSLDVSSFNTSKVTNMSTMFYICESLTSLDVSNFNTENVTNMSTMFMSCRRLASLDVSGFNTENVTNMKFMFSLCPVLTNLDLSSFNTAKVTNMAYMFEESRNLTTIYAGDGWSTAAVTESQKMFWACSSLVGGQGTTYNSSQLDAAYAHIDGGPDNPGYFTAKAEAYAVFTQDDATLTFYYDVQRNSRPGTTFDLNEGTDPALWCTEDGTYTSVVTRVVFDSSFADARPTSTKSWFCDMSQLQSITGMKYLNTEAVTCMTYMFRNCTSLTVIDLSYFNTANVTNMGAMFYGCTNLTTIYAGDGWTTVSVSSSSSTAMFFNCINLVGGQGTTYNILHSDKGYAHIDGGPSNPGYFTAKPEHGEAQVLYDPENTTLTFTCGDQRGTRSGTTYDLNTGATQPEWVTDGTCHYVTRVVFEPSFVEVTPTSTYAWFFDMNKLQSITGMEYLNTDSVTNMAFMFENCRLLTSIDLSHLNTSNVTTMEAMFENCRGLTSLDLSSFNTDKVTTMYCMFLDCRGLESVDLSSFTNAHVENMDNVFQDCSGLTTIYASSSWSTAAVTTSWAMFSNCTSLVGGMGTTFDENHVDAAYAHIDGGPSNPGYFTEKPSSPRGDVNGDGFVNISDVTALINVLLTDTGMTSSCDVSGDGFVNISDVTVLINFLLTDTWPN